MVNMQSMAKEFPVGVKDSSQTILRFIKEGILLPKMRGHIRNALYPSENVTRLAILTQLGLLGENLKTPYKDLRLTLWLAGFEVKGIVSDLKKIVLENSSLGKVALNSIVEGHNTMKRAEIKKVFGEDWYQKFQLHGMDEDLETLEDFTDGLTSLLPPIDAEEDRTQSYDLPNAYPSTYGDIDILGLIPILLDGKRTSIPNATAFLDGLEADQVKIVGKITGILLGFMVPVPVILMSSNEGKGNVETAITLTVSLLAGLSTMFGWDFIQKTLTFASKDTYLDETKKVTKK